MANSLSPQPSVLPPTGIFSNTNRLSATPPIPPVVSKRHKRMNALSERLNDISAHFAQNRDVEYRSQLQALQLDMNFINRANLYQDRPLDDFSDDIVAEINSSIANNGSRAGQAGSRMPDIEAPPAAGKWASKFVDEINDTMEQRDTQLTDVAERRIKQIQALQEENVFKIQVAQEEHKKLAASIRDRLIHTVGQKKARLIKEKEQLDIADTNALLFHPTQFSITNPASPGGAQSNRKTRHTRHRLEVDDLGTLGEGNKRKRIVTDADNGSPGPTMRAIEAEVMNPWKESQLRMENHQMTAPLYSIDRLFSEKELAMHFQAASHATVDYFRNKNSGDSNGGDESGTITNGDATDEDDNLGGSGNGTMINEGDAENEDIPMAAPEMDRTANQSTHATRSTRNKNPHTGKFSITFPDDMAGRAAAIPLYGSSAKERKKEDENRAPGLSEQEKADDIAMMKVAMDEQKSGRWNTKLLEHLCEPKMTTNSLGGLFMSKQPSLTGKSDIGGFPMSRDHSGIEGSAMKRSASAADYMNGNGGKRAKIR